MDHFETFFMCTNFPEYALFSRYNTINLPYLHTCPPLGLLQRISMRSRKQSVLFLFYLKWKLTIFFTDFSVLIVRSMASNVQGACDVCFQIYFNLIKVYHKDEKASLRGSITQNCLIFQLCFIMLQIMLYVCRILSENFIQIGQ